MEDIEKTTEISFHGIDYIMKISTRDDILSIVIEQKDSGNRWKNSFNATYIEEITQKTGNAKKFNVFVKMLFSSISGSSDHVFLDILTYHDLEMLKARKQKNNSNNTSYSVDKSKSNKRYLILTYVGEFDKVHYPLPLNFEENPDIETLKSTIQRLRSEIDDLKSSKSISQNTGDGFFMTQAAAGGDHESAKSELNSLKNQNDELKKKISSLEEAIKNSANQNKKVGAVEYDLVLKGKLDLENEVETLKKEYVRDVGKLKKRVEDAEKELDDSRAEVTRLRTELLDPENEERRARGNDGDPNQKKIIARQQKEVERLIHEVDNMRNLDKKQKARIRQLETELESALKRVTYSRGSNYSTGSPYSRSRNASPSNTSANKRSNSQPGRSNSPIVKTNERKETPTRKQPVQNNRNIFNRTPPSTKKTTLGLSNGSDNSTAYRGVLKQRNSNSPSLRISGISANTGARKTTPQKNSLGTIKDSPTNSSLGIRKASPTNTYGLRKNSPGTDVRKQSPNRTSPTYKSGYSILDKSPVDRLKGQGGLAANIMNKKTTKLNYQTDSEDEGISLRNTRNQRPTMELGTSKLGESNAQKLKENIHEFRDSKAKPIVKDNLEASVDVGDIDERLSKLQDLLRMAKS